MTRRHVTTAVTMVVLIAILVLGVVIGANSLLAPVPSNDTPSASASPTCVTKTVRKGQRIRPAQVQVSVFNGGTRGGLAGDTMDSLAKRGFKRGRVGNAPATAQVRRVQVWTTQRNDDAARLVALQFGRSTNVRFTRADLGPGVDVVVGDKFHTLGKHKRFVVVQKSSSVCVPVAGAGSASG
jgi:LytR cell envelope-related transcriptional attenuator